MLKVRKIKRRFLLLLGLVTQSGALFASVDKESVAPSFWSDARAHVFQLSELLSSNLELDSLPKPPQPSSSRLNSLCATQRVPGDVGEKSCAAALYRASMVEDGAITPELLRNALRKLRQQRVSSDWNDSFYLAATLVKENQIELAASYLDETIAAISETQDVSDWMIHRFRVYRWLVSLLAKADAGELPAGLLVSPDIEPAKLSSSAIARRIESLQGGITIGESYDSKAKKHESAIQLLKYEKWRLDQERDEIRAIAARITQSGLSADVIARTNLLAERFDVESAEWRALVQVIARTSSGAELLSRNHDAITKHDVWLLSYLKNRLASPKVPDDTVVRVDLVSRHSVNVLRKVLASIEQENPYSLQKARGQILAERIEALTGEFHQLTESVSYHPRVRIFRGLVETALRCRKSVHQLHARMVALENTVPNDAEKFQQIRTLFTEIGESRQIYFELLQSAARLLHTDDPMVSSRLLAMTKRMSRLVATANDLESFSRTLPRPLPSEVFNEVRALFHKMNVMLSESIERKKSEAEILRKSLLERAEELQSVVRDAQEIVDSSNSKLAAIVIRLLQSIDSDLANQQRRFDFEIASNNAAFADVMLKKKDELESALKEMNEVERLRRENLEWRLAQ